MSQTIDSIVEVSKPQSRNSCVIFENHEYNILRKYKQTNYVNKQDRATLEKYVFIGWVNFGLDIENSKETARLSERGLSWIKREETWRNPIKKFFLRYIGMFGGGTD